MPAKWKKFTKEQIEEFAKNSLSYAALAKKMGYSANGGSGIKAIKEAISFYQIDISHFLGQNHNKNNFDYSRFKYGNNIKSIHMLDAIVYLRGHKCEKCQRETWEGQPIPLEVHHKDGDHLNNELENLELLCPNCHALTENWRGKNKNKKDIVKEEQFVKALKLNKSIRQALISLGLTSAGGNYARAYELINKYQIQHLMK